jgi:hypothetical protein
VRMSYLDGRRGATALDRGPHAGTAGWRVALTVEHTWVMHLL